MAKLYPYQEQVDKLIRSGRSVVLQAPTGAGKTRAALFPFLDGWRNDPSLFPRQCIYVVPLRVLANQFEHEYRQTVERYTVSHGLREVGWVAVQTGARPDDPQFKADLTFTTIDQFLSSFLTIPYSLSDRQANLNAGTLISSYLVFDEFHLFPVDDHGNGALTTVLHVLKMLKGITPFVLMTATFSKAMLQHLCKELDAEAVTLTPDEIEALPSQQGKQRRYRYVGRELTADAIAEDVLGHSRMRTIAVCNTVNRAQALAEALRNDPRLAGVQVELLHSRFYASDREAKENAIRREFGEDKTLYRDQPMILVATQVIEVGLNITCEALHTELAPANAIVQRAGRCARFVGERGEVLIYDVPLKEGRPDFAPYLTACNCERTLAALQAWPAEGQVLAYHGELELVNIAHEPFDQKLLDRLHSGRHHVRAAIERVLRTQDRSAARALIRDVDTITVLVHSNPTASTLPNPYCYEGIALRRKALLKWYRTQCRKALLKWYRTQYEQVEMSDVGWIVKLPAPIEPAISEGPEQHRHIQMAWNAPVVNVREACRQIATTSIVVVNPALVQYDAELGFRLTSGVPAKASPQALKRRNTANVGPLRCETYADHIAGLYRVYCSDLRDRTAAARCRLEQRYGLPVGALDRAIRLMFAIHDLGKLDRVWQEWAHAWQTKVSELRGEDLRIPPDYMAAHTDYDPKNTLECSANTAIRPPRPPHAAESAWAGHALIQAAAGGNVALCTALITAIICHHNAGIRMGHGQFAPAPAARAAFNEAMRRVGLHDDTVLRASGAQVLWQGFAAAESLSSYVIDVGRTEQVLLYLFLVRILRLADQGSQEV